MTTKVKRERESAGVRAGGIKVHLHFHMSGSGLHFESVQGSTAPYKYTSLHASHTHTLMEIVHNQAKLTSESNDE